MQFGVGRRTTYAQAGDIVVFDLAQPVDNINTEFRHVTSMWPRVAIEEVMPDIAHWHGHALPKDNPAVALLRIHMTSCFDMADHLTQAQSRRVEAATLSLAGAAMTGVDLLEESEEHPAMTEVLTYQLKRYIRENLSSPLRLAFRGGGSTNCSNRLAALPITKGTHSAGNGVPTGEYVFCSSSIRRRQNFRPKLA